MSEKTGRLFRGVPRAAKKPGDRRPEHGCRVIQGKDLVPPLLQFPLARIPGLPPFNGNVFCFWEVLSNGLRIPRALVGGDDAVGDDNVG